MRTHQMCPRIKQFAALMAAQAWMAPSCVAAQNDLPQTSVAFAALQSAAEPNLVVLQLQRAVKNCDEEILRTANSLVYRSGVPKDAIGVLASAWGPSSGSTGCRQSPRIRAFIAEALAQGHANGIVDRIDVQSVRVALRGSVESEDPETASASVLGLVAIAEPEDFSKLEALARNKDSVARTEVVHALAMQCLDEPAAVLRRLEGEFEAGYVDRIRQDMAPVRDANCKKDNRN